MNILARLSLMIEAKMNDASTCVPGAIVSRAPEYMRAHLEAASDQREAFACLHIDPPPRVNCGAAHPAVGFLCVRAAGHDADHASPHGGVLWR